MPAIKYTDLKVNAEFNTRFELAKIVAIDGNGNFMVDFADRVGVNIIERKNLKPFLNFWKTK